MADPFDIAAEQVAPRRATTNYFNPKEGVLSRYANAGTTLESARDLAQSTSRLAQDRWDRSARARTRKLWGQEDEEIAAKKDFQASRGAFLGDISRLDETADDYERARNELIATLPEEALKDPAVRDIISFKDRVSAERKATRSREEQEQRYLTRWEKQQADQAAYKAAEAGVPEDVIRSYMTKNDWTGLYRETGRRERDYAAQVAASKKEGPEPASSTALDDEANFLMGDYEAFPLHDDEDFNKRRKPDTYYAEATKAKDRKAFIDQIRTVKAWEKIKNDPQKVKLVEERRGRFYDIAQEKAGRKGLLSKDIAAPTAAPSYEGVDIGSLPPEQQAEALGAEAPTAAPATREDRPPNLPKEAVDWKRDASGKVYYKMPDGGVYPLDS